MADAVNVRIDGQELEVAPGTIVAVAVMMAGVITFRRSVVGEARAPLCGMGVCMECRVTIDGVSHSRSCQTLCVEGMEIRTDA
ncbi:MAG: (2Fe-2S)-binding protein [Bryobacteraceae bacterium]